MKTLAHSFFALFCVFANSLFGQAVGETNSSELSPFEKAELRRLLDLDFLDLSRTPVRGVLGYEQEHWKNPASVHVIRPEDISLNGHVLTVDSFRNVAGMYTTRGVGYDDFVTMRNFSGSATEKFLTMVDGREVLQLMGGTINWTTEDVPLSILDRVEIIRGPGASIWGTNAVSGVVNIVTKHSAQTQGDSVRLIIEDDGTFLGEYVHGGQISDDSFYRVWVRDQEYSEGKLISGMDARDDGYARKAGFRFDKELGSDMDFTFAGGFATRRVDHAMDLSSRLLYPTDPNYALFPNPFLPADGMGGLLPIASNDEFPFIPISVATALSLPGVPPQSKYSTWPAANGLIQPIGIPRIDHYEKMPQDGSHLRAKISGITENELEWSVAGYAEIYDTTLGHIGHSWERREYDLDFRANKPIGDFNHLAFGASYRHMSFDVNEVVTSPWAFPTVDTSIFASTFDLNKSLRTDIPILEYGGSPTKFERIAGFIQHSTDLSDQVVFSFGAKFEDSDLSGSSIQPGVRISYSLDDENIFWGAYSRANRQASLVEQYTEVSYARIWSPADKNATNPLGKEWINTSFSGSSDHDDEKMDAFELGWRTRPSDKLLLELSLYHYSTKDAVFSGPPVYTTSDVKTTGGELTFDYRASNSWHLQGGYSYSKGKKDGVKQDDFPDSMANLSSHYKIRDNLTFIQSLYYTGDRIIPSAYNPIPIDDYLRLDLGFVWQTKDNWEIGFFGRDLLDPDHPENMYNDLDVEPGRVERTFLLSITKKF
ncbi:TonB-dependent receptor [Opitutales bacterium]|nr:TonB-dependent receptor [Opitutales bacterium]